MLPGVFGHVKSNTGVGGKKFEEGGGSRPRLLGLPRFIRKGGKKNIRNTCAVKIRCSKAEHGDWERGSQMKGKKGVNRWAPGS